MYLFFEILFQYDVPVDANGKAVFTFPGDTSVAEISICIVRVGMQTIMLKGLEVTVCTQCKLLNHLSRVMLLQEPTIFEHIAAPCAYVFFKSTGKTCGNISIHLYSGCT